MQLPIIDKKEVADGTVEISLGIEGSGCSFKPGQYVSIVVPDLLFQDEKGNRRDFSIASSPNNKKSISIAFRVSQSAFKQTLLKLPTGSMVEVDCCYGALTMPDDALRPLVLIAGGIGVTPFLSAIRFASEEKLPHKITLVYGNRDEKSAAYLSELEELDRKNSNFVFKKLFGPITEEVLKESAGFGKNPLWYIVGSTHMVRGVRNMLLGMGVSGENIRFEEFPGYGKRVGDQDNREPEKNHLVAGQLTVDDLDSLLQAINKSALFSETDERGTITYANDMFCSVSRYSREELIGSNHRVLKSGFHPPSFYEEMWKTISSGRVWRGEVKNKAKDGSFYWVDASIAPIFGKDGKIAKYIAVRFPITDKKKLEEEFRVRIEELEKINTLMLGRELKMVELKEKLAKTEEELKKLRGQ